MHQPWQRALRGCSKNSRISNRRRYGWKDPEMRRAESGAVTYGHDAGIVFKIASPVVRVRTRVAYLPRPIPPSPNGFAAASFASGLIAVKIAHSLSDGRSRSISVSMKGSRAAGLSSRQMADFDQSDHGALFGPTASATPLQSDDRGSIPRRTAPRRTECRRRTQLGPRGPTRRRWSRQRTGSRGSASNRADGLDFRQPHAGDRVAKP